MEPQPIALAYAAKSTEDRHGSIPHQLADCRKLAEAEGLEKAERPSTKRREVPELGYADPQKLIAALEPRWRPLFSAYPYLGLRSSEARGLTWEHVDLSAGIVRVRQQVGRDKVLVSGGKTDHARRDVYLKGEVAKLARVLREHKLASHFSQPGDLVFSSSIVPRCASHRLLGRGTTSSRCVFVAPGQAPPGSY